MTQSPFFMNPFQITELMIDQSLKALHNSVKVAEQGDKMAQQVIDFNRKNREESVKMVETFANQAKQNTRALVEMTEKWTAFYTNNYKQVSKATSEHINKQVAQFSKS